MGSDLRSRFRRTRLGILWALLQPLGFALVIAAVWGGLNRSASYWDFAVYVFSGHIVFEMFGNTLIAGQDSLLNAGGYLRQARIPFLVFQVRPVLTGAVVFSFAQIGLLGMVAALGMMPALGPQLFLLPAFVGLYVLFLIPLAVIMSSVGLNFRDLKHISGLFVQAMFLLSPVMLPREVLAQPPLNFMEYVNPLVPLLDMFRDPILKGAFWDQQDVIVVSLWIAGLWVLAIITAVSFGRRLVYAI